MITFIGEEKTTQRIVTGFHSFDRAFKNRNGDIGFPVRGMCEISGYAGVGKSTASYALAGRIAALFEANIAIADLEEHFDRQFAETVLVNSGFHGTVNVVSGEQDSAKLESLIKVMRGDDYAVGIVDSIGAISPVSEAEGGLEDASMGRRAKFVAVLSRQIIHAFNMKKTPSILFITNHVHQIIGGRGTLTSGGKVKEYLSTTRLRLSVKETFDDGSTLIGGKVDKNSFGYSKRPFLLFNLAGWGIHPGLTAVHDCILYGIAKASRTVKLGDKSFGYMKSIIMSSDDEEMFAPFIEALKERAGEDVAIAEESEE